MPLGQLYHRLFDPAFYTEDHELLGAWVILNRFEVLTDHVG